VLCSPEYVAHLRWDTSGPSPKNHVNWVILDSDWKAEFCRVAGAHPNVIADTKNHNLGREPYRHQYAPTYIDAQKARSGYEKKGRALLDERDLVRMCQVFRRKINLLVLKRDNSRRQWCIKRFGLSYASLVTLALDCTIECHIWRCPWREPRNTLVTQLSFDRRSSHRPPTARSALSKPPSGACFGPEPNAPVAHDQPRRSKSALSSSQF
jgi:hypothetical protein